MAPSFGKALRIRSRGEFQTIQRRGRRRHSPHFIVISIDRPTATVPRLGITVSRMVGNSVVLNRVKRRVRELFRVIRHELPPTADFVVIAKPGAGELTSTASVAELSTAFGL
ncbi:MAG: ribonuclease P protein component [Candidatus Binatia bacterium]